MIEEYYKIRQWDTATGLQTRAKLEGLELEDVAYELERTELVR
jgi:aldehyde:ferredoxin oxidoreductase